MNISGIGASSSVASINTSSYSSSSVNINTSSQTSSSSSASGNSFMQDIFAALKSSGINVPPPPPPGSAQGGDNSSNNTSKQEIGQALHAMMHSLFQALNASGSQSNSGDSDDASSSSSSDVYFSSHDGLGEFHFSSLNIRYGYTKCYEYMRYSI